MISIYTVLAVVSLLLTQLAASVHSVTLYYVSSLLSGFFIAVPYAMMEMAIMGECSYFKPNRALSLASLNTQAAAAVAGYPVSVVFKWLGSYRFALLLEVGLVAVATFCLWVVVALNRKIEVKEKVE